MITEYRSRVSVGWVSVRADPANHGDSNVSNADATDITTPMLTRVYPSLQTKTVLRTALTPSIDQTIGPLLTRTSCRETLLVPIT